MNDSMEDPALHSWEVGLLQPGRRDEIKHSWDGSYEQSCCFCSGCCATILLEAYVFGRVTPSEQHPLCHFLRDETKPEHELFCSLVPMCIMCLNATSARADHSFCCGKARLGIRAAKNGYERLFRIAHAESVEGNTMEVGFYDNVPTVPIAAGPYRVPEAAKKRE